MSVDFSPPSLKHSGLLELTVDFKANLLDDKLDGELALPDVPLPGKWRWAVSVAAKGGDTLEVLIKHVGAPYAAFGERVSTGTEIFWIGGMSVTMPLDELRNFAKKAVPVFDPARPQPYRLVFRLEQSSPLLEASAPALEELAARSSDLSLNLIPHDVRLFFPSRENGGLELWTTSHLLSASSDYYADLFTSGFSETTARRSKRARKSEPDAVLTVTNAKDSDDSDDEADEVFLGGQSPNHSELPETSDFSFRQVTISQSAFSTYRAFLTYQQTGSLRFAPLRSSSSPQNPSSSTNRRSFLVKAQKDKPNLPLPVSPKSLYRLAHFLRLKQDNPLTSACLEAFSSSLSIEGAARELFSDASVCYDELRKLVLDYVVKNWDEVSATASWKELLEKIKRDEVPGGAAVFIELTQARDEAAKEAKA